MDFINEACRALEGGEEISFRAGISRAYYGLYSAAIDYADKLSPVPISSCAGSTHKKLVDFLAEQMAGGRDLVLKHRQLSYKLKAMHGHRVKADYYLDDEVYRDEAEAVLLSCRDMITKIEALGAA
ncbi:hypothetical protein RHP75_15665 [Pseudomonas sp. SG20056]|uniref:hypothetical protein n=1 Tax=Pseudomonas sp. SG20056 TaxID=3074146 RepID=UPI00287F560C|nr:hypothetical protein [Pseudomonas sp. SG20056]WNF45802.1 hypothetical protein RHP75_15665 [Pseudomonas sp. SG20056]